jgi:putative sporulation protein YtaF
MIQVSWLSSILLSLSSNLDNIAVGITYGIRRVRVPFTSNIVIALITGTGTLVSMLAGKTIGNLLNPRAANLLGGTILVGLGSWVVLQQPHSVFNNESPGKPTMTSGIPPEAGLVDRVRMILNNPFSADRDGSKHIDIKEALLLGLALSLNNLINGVAAGIAGMGPTLVTVLVVCFSIITLWCGLSVGGRLGARLLGNYTGVTSGVLLIVLGLYEILCQSH